MSFIWPVMLVWLVLVPLFIALYVALQQRRRQLVARYGSLGMVQGALGREPGLRRHLPPALFVTGFTLLIVALARPQMVVSLPREEGTILLAFDVSGSMAADDLQPTRMEAAKAVARDFVARQPSSVLIGVVAFSDSGFAVQAPTDDRDAVLASINRLAPARGTSLGSGIVAALNILDGEAVQTPEEEAPVAPTPLPEGTYAPAVIVLLTDGENNVSPDPLLAAQAAADRGVRIYTIGIGTAAGATLNIEGFAVHSQLDEASLQRIALLTDGAYYNAQSEDDLRAIYEQLDPQLVIKTEKMEVTSLLAGLSLAILLVGGAFSLIWFSRVP